MQVKDGKTLKNTGSTELDLTEKTINPMISFLFLDKIIFIIVFISISLSVKILKDVLILRLFYFYI
jgi:hypothetical protein